MAQERKEVAHDHRQETEPGEPWLGLVWFDNVAFSMTPFWNKIKCTDASVAVLYNQFNCSKKKKI